jgi:hypothetical protein
MVSAVPGDPPSSATLAHILICLSRCSQNVASRLSNVSLIWVEKEPKLELNSRILPQARTFSTMVCCTTVPSPAPQPASFTQIVANDQNSQQ